MGVDARLASLLGLVQHDYITQRGPLLITYTEIVSQVSGSVVFETSFGTNLRYTMTWDEGIEFAEHGVIHIVLAGESSRATHPLGEEYFFPKQACGHFLFSLLRTMLWPTR